MAGGHRTRLRVEEYGWDYLTELARAAVSCECVGAQLVRYDMSKDRGVWWEVTTETGEGSCGAGLCWRTAGEDRTRLSVEEYGRNYVMELARAGVLCECVGAQLMEI